MSLWVPWGLTAELTEVGEGELGSGALVLTLNRLGNPLTTDLGTAASSGFMTPTSHMGVATQ